MQERQHKNTAYPLSCVQEWIRMQNNGKMGFTWRDNGLGKYISFSAICPCYHERRWNFHIRNATSNHTVYYAQKMVVRLTREKSSVAPRERKQKTVFLESKVYWSQKMQPISFILVVPIDTVLWHVRVMNYKTAPQQTTAFLWKLHSSTVYTHNLHGSI